MAYALIKHPFFSLIVYVGSWLITRKMVWLAQSNYLSTPILLQHVTNLFHDADSKSITIKYVRFQDPTSAIFPPLKYDELTSSDIVESTLELANFQSLSVDSFSDLGVLWRQEIQLQSIRLAFADSDGDSADDALTRHVLHSGPCPKLDVLPRPAST
jgi:hypothetical protein